MDVNDSPRFLKTSKKFFHQLKSKGNGSRQCEKCHLLHDVEIYDITETLKEEFNEIKLHMKPQAIQSTAVIGPAFLMFLYLDMHVMSLEQLFRVPIKYIIGKDTNFALIRKAIFDGITKTIFTASRDCSFAKKKNQKQLRFI